MFAAILPALVLIPILAGAGLLAHRAWGRYQREKQVAAATAAEAAAPKECDLPSGAIHLAAASDVRPIRKALVGSYMFVAIGTFGINQVGRLLRLLAACGLDKLVGSILVLENDAQVLAKFLVSVPDCYKGRLVSRPVPSFAGGMGNNSIEWVLDRIDLWGTPVVEAMHEGIDLHLRLNQSRVPSLICLFDGLGGQSPIGIPALAELKAEFEESLAVGFTSLPIHTRLRQRYPAMKASYERHGLFGWVLTDNLGTDPTTADYGMAATIVALADAALYEDRAAQPNNAIKLALTEEPGGILVYQVVASRVVAYSCPCAPADAPRYFAYEDPVFVQAVKGLRKLDRGEGTWSAKLPIGGEDVSTFDMVLSNLPHGDLTRLSDKINSARDLHHRYGAGSNGRHQDLIRQPNHDLVFASVADGIDPTKPTGAVNLIRLAAVRNGAQLVEEIIKPPHERGFVPQPMVVPNGHVVDIPLERV